MTKLSAKWIWYANDFELWAYHKMTKKRRQRCDLIYPAWVMDRPEYQVVFLGEYDVPEDTSFKIYHNGEITVSLNNNPWFVENKEGEIPLKKGKGTIRVYCMAETGLPCIFIDSEYVKTNESWKAYCIDARMIEASVSDMFTTKEYGPMDYALPVKRLDAVSVKEVNGGLLYDFGRELLGIPVATSSIDKTLNLYYGESDLEAVDFENSEVCENFDLSAGIEFKGKESRGFRYVYLKNPDWITEFYVLEELYVTDFKPEFNSSDELLNKIYQTAKYTLEVTSREFYIDGPKRDRWTWAGDVLQSEWFNFYTFFDKEIVKRTLTAIIGKQEIRSNVSGILDYNFYYILSVYFYYKFTGDLDFVKKLYPRLESLMRFILKKPKKDGFLMAKNEWIFIDWTNIPDFSKTNNAYPVSLIQILYYKCLETMILFEDLLCKEHNPIYQEEIFGYKERINKTFFDDKIGAFYHDSAHTLKTKYGNIFAVLLDFANENQKKQIAKSLTEDQDFYQIYTPFMKFFELCAVAETGNIEYVFNYVNYYWGGMINEGATTFWEKYEPDQKGAEKYAMYGRKYGKSLCHSWGAGPLYLIAKYLVGITPLCDGYDEYALSPHVGKIKFESKLPLKNSELKVKYDGEYLYVYSPKTSGVIRSNNNIDCSNLEYSKEKCGYVLQAGVEYRLKTKGDENIE